MSKRESVMMKWGTCWLWLAVLFWCAYGLLACGDEATTTPPCVSGELGCSCSDGRCLPGLDCAAGLCVLSSCEPGQPGCTCTAELRCLPGLQCVQNGAGGSVCEDATCEPGSEACACFEGVLCREGLSCSAEGICEPGVCVPGTPGCPCGNEDSCDDGASCRGDTCVRLDAGVGGLGEPCNEAGECFGLLECNVDLVCAPIERYGYEGTPCGSGRACFDGLWCNSANECVPLGRCEEGEAGCSCGDDSDCRADLLCNYVAEEGRSVCQPVVACAALDVGLEGCPCFDDGTCETSALRCLRTDEVPRDVCRSACPEGTETCACIESELGGVCNDGLLCIDDACTPRYARPGGLNGPCYANGTCDRGTDGAWLACQDGLCREPGCVQGELGCSCFTGATCATGLLCDPDFEGGRCVLPDCSAGDENCGCRPDRTCGRTADGVSLVCDGRVCVEPDCDVGTEGCLCEPNYECDANLICDSTSNRCSPAVCRRGDIACGCLEDATCNTPDLVCGTDRTCQAVGCAQGDEGCGCFADFSCNDVPGDETLVCEAGRCQRRRADASGTIGAACFENNTCNPGGLCEGGVCERCVLGSMGCACFGSDTCVGGLACVAGFCLDPTTTTDVEREPPAEPQCWTPCRDGLLGVDGTFRACSPDGLMAGCIQGTTCVQGSCVVDGATPESCVSDLECPVFQTCIAGRCYSECERDSECGPGQACHLRVCRTPCNAAMSGACGTVRGVRTFCEVLDGENGVCMPLAEPETASVGPVLGGVLLEDDALSFTSSATAGQVLLTNDSEVTVRVTVRKARQTTFAGSAALHCTLESYESGTVPLGCPARVGDAAPPLLSWLELGAAAVPTTGVVPSPATSRVQTLTFDVPPLSQHVLRVSNAGGTSNSVWEGELVVEAATVLSGGALGRASSSQRVLLNYAQSLDGQWSGEVYYFAQFGDENLAAWQAGTLTEGQRVGNALLQQFSAFYGGSTVGLLQAAITSALAGSWDREALQERAPECRGSGRCYPYLPPEGSTGTDSGFRVFTTNTVLEPIPAGAIELPFAMSIAARTPGNQNAYGGRVRTAQALQYPNNPALIVEFESSALPGGCNPSLTASGCVRRLTRFDLRSVLGGRYATTRTDTSCGGNSALVPLATPWLLPGFTRGTDIDPDTGRRYTWECREAGFPRQASRGEDVRENPYLAGGNPVPDGDTRVRQLSLVTGFVVNADTMYVVVRENFSSFLNSAARATTDSDGLSAYALLVLRRSSGPVDAELVGTVPTTVDPLPVTRDLDRLAVSCDPALVASALGGSGVLSSANADRVADALLSGQGSGGTVSQVVTSRDDRLTEQVHYLCEETGVFDGGPSADRDGRGAECPAGSNVVFFTTLGLTQAEINSQACQSRGTCKQTLDSWVAEQRSRGNNLESGGAGSCMATADPATTERCVVQLRPLYRCSDGSAFCDRDRVNLRSGKSFFRVGDTSMVFQPLPSAVSDAFRYLTRFQTRDGGNLAFVPSLCVDGSQAVPYCYSASGIEEVELRTDCLLALFSDFYGSLDASTRSSVRLHLESNFSGSTGVNPVSLATQERDGFEALNAQLLVALGDDAYTAAFASRFDLAGSGSASFEGTLFEPNGIVLSSSTGFEMLNLYRAVQYYQRALDRFYRTAPYLWQSLEQADGARVFTRDSVDDVDTASSVRYLERLIRASAQKSRAVSEIARRYQSLNQPGLATAVLERAYVSTYMESALLSRLMQDIALRSTVAQRAEWRVAIEQAARRFRMALLDMRGVYATLGVVETYFGFPVDYVPLPAVDAGSNNAVELTLATARDRVATARVREDAALASNRSFETDEVAFQNELVRLRTTYESNLGQICGTFVPAGDTRAFPAIPRYAELDTRTLAVGNPCGLVGNGSIFEAAVQLDRARVALEQSRNALNNVRSNIDIEVRRVNAQCGLTQRIADYNWNTAGRVNSLQNLIDDTQDAMAVAQRMIDRTASIANLSKCGGFDCISAVAGAVLFNGVAAATEIVFAVGDSTIDRARNEIADIERDSARWNTLRQCDAAQIDSRARVSQYALELANIRLNILLAQYDLRAAVGGVQGLQNEASRLMAEQEEAEQLAIDLEGARNDPNVRIYRNDAILNATISFERALREVYRATRVYEYYTSSTYAGWEQLFLIRMVGSGDYNLENYLADLEDAFYAFQETNGLPDTRVAVLSLRDDVLSVPRVDANGGALSQTERVARFREMLADPMWLDRDGYLTVPFSLGLGALSPLTRNHKVLYVEAEVIGTDVGDGVGRLYVTQSGTGLVAPIADEEPIYYTLPERTAVLNPFFNGQRLYDPVIYRNGRLRDRPLANSGYALTINQRDEAANLDINLASLTDVRLYVYYTDFTAY